MRQIYVLGSIFLLFMILFSCSDDKLLNEKISVYQFSAAASPEEAGEVSPSEGEFGEGEAVEFTATAAENWIFESWQGDYTGTGNPGTVTMDSDKEVIALFERRDFALNITTEGEGVVHEQLLKQKSTDYEAGSVVEVTAVAEEGWAFSRWEGDLEGNENPAMLEMESEKNITAVFERRAFALNIEIEGEGTVQERSLQEGSAIELTAAAEEGWRFSHWDGDLEGNENPATLEMDSEKSVTAVFERQTYSLTIETEGSGSVSETLISGTQTGDGYQHQSVVELTAEPETGWHFVRWEGDLEGNENPATLDIDREKNITAVFERREYPLTIEIEGQGTVSEEVVRTKTDYPYETVVQLTANPSTGWEFVRWEGDLNGSDNPEQIEIDEEKEVTAVFEPLEVSLTIETEGSGTVSESLISGSETGSGYEHGAIVELTANPATGWEFDRWEGDASGSDNPERIEMTESKEVRAVFVQQTFTLSVETEGSGTVSETLISGSESGSGYEHGAIVELTANPATGWGFDKWEGDASGSDNPERIEMTESKEVRAVFVQDFVELSVDTEGAGEVEIELISGDRSGNSFQTGSEVRITAVAGDGWHFSEWDDDADGTQNPLIFIIEDDTKITAVFERNEYSLSVTADGQGSVSEQLLDGDETDNGYLFESEVELEAIPSGGWAFVEWRGDLSGAENPAIIIIDQNKSVTAVFEQVYSLDLSVDGPGSVTTELIEGSGEGDNYTSGSVVRITVNPGGNWTFVEWSGDISGTDNPVEITVESDISATAHLEMTGDDGDEDDD